MRNEHLEKAVAAMGEAVLSDTPTMFWTEAMEHVAVLLEHVPIRSNATDLIGLARTAISEGQLLAATQHLNQVLHCLNAQASEHVVRLSDLLVDFEAARNAKPFLCLEIGYHRSHGWMITIYDKAGGHERVFVQVEGLRTDDTCRSASLHLQDLIKEETHD